MKLKNKWEKKRKRERKHGEIDFKFLKINVRKKEEERERENIGGNRMSWLLHNFSWMWEWIGKKTTISFQNI